jgi:hypothetical protein
MVTTCNNYPLGNGTALPNSGIYSRTPLSDATPQQKCGSHTAPMLRMEVPSAWGPYEFHQQDARDDDSPDFPGFQVFGNHFRAID